MFTEMVRTALRQVNVRGASTRDVALEAGHCDIVRLLDMAWHDDGVFTECTGPRQPGAMCRAPP